MSIRARGIPFGGTQTHSRRNTSTSTHLQTQRCEWLPTSVEFFRRGFRSVYVNEIDETLSLGFDETQKLVGRVQEVFENHLSATEVLVQDPLGLLKAKYTTRMHRLFVMEELWQGFFMVRCLCGCWGWGAVLCACLCV